MNRKQTRIYLSLAPLLFGLSWYISHRMYTDYLKSGVNSDSYQGGDHAFVYATVLTSIYLIAYFIIADLYKKNASKP